MEIKEILAGLDRLFAKKEMEKVEPYLQEHLKHAMELGDASSVITIVNELIGFYRSMRQHEKSMFYCNQILSFMQMCELEGTVPYATTLLNVATANRAAGRLLEAMEYYREVEAIYEGNLEKDDYRYAGLYNNMSLVYEEKGEYQKSVELLNRALPIIEKFGIQGRIELATTYTNLAACFLKEAGEAKDASQSLMQAEKYGKMAEEIFREEGGKDYHYGALLSILGELSFRKEAYESAADYYEKALLSIYENTGITKACQDAGNRLREVYHKLGIQVPENGMDLSREYYEQVGKPMLLERFPEYFPQMTIGLVGEGSDCFRFDDEVSRDHDFGPGFCIWITDALYEEIGKELQEAYEQLPPIYKGMIRISTAQGRGRVGVFKIGSFYKRLLGIPVIPESLEEWAAVEEYRLAAATNGAVFKDAPNGFSIIREKLLSYYPKEFWHSRLAEEAVHISQSGQYNYGRMMLRGDLVTGEIAMGEFIKHVMAMVYLLNKSYAPYYKWMHKGMKELSWGSEIGKLLEKLSLLPSQEEAWIGIQEDELLGKINEKDEKSLIVEKICTVLLEKLKEEGLATGDDNYLEHHVSEIYR
ncbi:MAG: DUF4037 domain-containing protein [Lachnospiraceae bacterium]|nr:DUF4037 domain-containing protein [Lachnospiraceae bacterium]